MNSILIRICVVVFCYSELHSLAYKNTLINIYFFFLVKVQLIYSVVLISAVQQSASVIHIYILFIFFSIMVYHQLLNIAPCATQQNLVIHPFYIYQFASSNSHSISPSPLSPLPVGNHRSVLHNIYFFMSSISIYIPLL